MSPVLWYAGSAGGGLGGVPGPKGRRVGGGCATCRAFPLRLPRLPRSPTPLPLPFLASPSQRTYGPGGPHVAAHGPRGPRGRVLARRRIAAHRHGPRVPPEAPARGLVRRGPGDGADRQRAEHSLRHQWGCDGGLRCVSRDAEGVGQGRRVRIGFLWVRELRRWRPPTPLAFPLPDDDPSSV